MNKFLIIGQIPPPFLGQATMIKNLLDIESNDFQLFHVNLSFSEKASEFGRLSIKKIFLFPKIIFEILFHRFINGTDIIYYCPSGHRKIPILRDVIILFWSRPLFKKTIFHFHAYGIHRVYNSSNIIFKYFISKSFFRPDMIIKLTKDINYDELLIKPISVRIIPNGIEDSFSKHNFRKKERLDSLKFKMLYVGAIYEERGIHDILLLAKKLVEKSIIDFEFSFIGEFMNKDYKNSVFKLLEENSILKYFNFKGQLIGLEKWKEYNDSDLLIFPSRVPSETFGLVIVEAMQFYKPSIVTSLNGPQYVVSNNFDSKLYYPGDIDDLSEKITHLKGDKAIYNKFALNARISYETKYKIEKFHKNIMNVFNEI